ncbi:MAG: hypothetical protein QY332_20550 [Anaerolineales bacterium]|nr:MAG: hypothetical protein QY332_20550 [Anaerolineales bacterium]
MNDDVRKYIYGALVVFLVGVLVWIGFIYISACGFTLTCTRGAMPVERTPIPTLLPATMPAMEMSGAETIPFDSDVCRVVAVDLIGAWVEAGSSETAAFQFTDVNGKNCESSFEEVRPLFVEANLWYSGSLSCVSCHSVDLEISLAQLDLSSYAGITSGSRRADAESRGTDILGAGNWESSLLYKFIVTSNEDIPGHTESISGLLIFAGKPAPVEEATATPSP